MAQFNVLMFGSRRAGKSSILSSMIDSFEKLRSTTASNITLTATEDTEGILKNKKTDLQKIFKMGTKERMRWTIDEDPTKVGDSYEFVMSAPESDKHILRFKDIPGEWLATNEAKVKEELRQSQIIIMAIDTPHLIEENGDHSDAFHNITNINALLSYIKSNEDVPRLVLLVPIKCEKYYYEGRMEEVVAEIEKQYEILLTALRTGKKKDLYTVAITPILSLGGIVFDDFERDADGDVVTFDDPNVNPLLYLRPKAAYYKLYEPKPVFAPKYCEQPVLYILSFISKQVKNMEVMATNKLPKKKNNGGLFDSVFVKIVLSLIAIIFHAYPMLALIWGDIFKDKEFVQTASKTAVHLQTTGDGYKILQDPLGIQNLA